TSAAAAGVRCAAASVGAAGSVGTAGRAATGSGRVDSAGGIGEDLGGGAFGGELAVVQEQGPVGDRGGQVDVVGGEQDRGAGGLLGDQQAGQPVPGGRVEALFGLVEDQQPARADQDRG